MYIKIKNITRWRDKSGDLKIDEMFPKMEKLVRFFKKVANKLPNILPIV